VGPAPKRRQGITAHTPLKYPVASIPAGQRWIPGRGFTTGSGAFGPKETPLHPVSAHQLNDYAPKPGRPIRPSRLVVLAVAAVVAPVTAVITTVLAVVAAVVAPVSALVHAVCDDDGTADSGHRPSAAPV
jgi:hypothetical protein